MKDKRFPFRDLSEAEDGVCGNDSRLFTKEQIAEDRRKFFEKLRRPEFQKSLKEFDKKRRQGAAARNGEPPYLEYESDELIYLPVYVHLFRQLETNVQWENVNYSSKQFWVDVMDELNEMLAGTHEPPGSTIGKCINNEFHGVESRLRFVLAPYLPKDSWYPYWGKDYRGGMGTSGLISALGGNRIIADGQTTSGNNHQTTLDRYSNIDNYASIPIDPYITLENPNLIACGPEGAVLTYNCSGPLGVANALQNYAEEHNPMFVPSNNYQGNPFGPNETLADWWKGGIYNYGSPMETYNSSGPYSQSGSMSYGSGNGTIGYKFMYIDGVKSHNDRWTAAFPGMNIMVSPSHLKIYTGQGWLNGYCNFPWSFSNGTLFLVGASLMGANSGTQYSVFDVAALCLHEFGHGMGLYHTFQGLSSTMVTLPTDSGSSSENGYGGAEYRFGDMSNLSQYLTHFPVKGTPNTDSANTGYENVDLTPPFNYVDRHGENKSYEEISADEKTWIEGFLGYASKITNNWKKFTINSTGYADSVTNVMDATWRSEVKEAYAARWFTELGNFNSFWGGSYKSVTNAYGYTSNKLVFNPTNSDGTRKGPDITTRIPFCKLDSNGDQTADFDPLWIINLNWLDPNYPAYPDNMEIEHAHDPITGGFDCPCLIDPTDESAVEQTIKVYGTNYLMNPFGTNVDNRKYASVILYKAMQNLHDEIGEETSLDDSNAGYSTRATMADEYFKYVKKVLGGYKGDLNAYGTTATLDNGAPSSYNHFNCNYVRYNIGTADCPNKIFHWGYYGFMPYTHVPKEFYYDYVGVSNILGSDMSTYGEGTGSGPAVATHGDWIEDTPSVRQYTRNYIGHSSKDTNYYSNIYYKFFAGSEDPNDDFYNPYKPATDSGSNITTLMYGESVTVSGIQYSIFGVEWHDYDMSHNSIGTAMQYDRQGIFPKDNHQFLNVYTSFYRNVFTPRQIRMAEAWVLGDNDACWGIGQEFSSTWPVDENDNPIYSEIDEATQMIAIVEDLLAGEDVEIINQPGEGECPPIGTIGEIIGTIAEYNSSDLCVFSVCNTFYEGPSVCNPFFPIMEALGTTAEDYEELIPQSLLDGEYGPVFTANDRECVYRVDNDLCFTAEEVITTPASAICDIYIAPVGYYSCQYGSDVVTTPFQNMVSLFTEDGSVYLGEVSLHNNNYFSAQGDIPLYTYGQLQLSGRANSTSPIVKLEKKSKKFEILRKNILKMCNFA